MHCLRLKSVYCSILQMRLLKITQLSAMCYLWNLAAEVTAARVACGMCVY